VTIVRISVPKREKNVGRFPITQKEKDPWRDVQRAGPPKKEGDPEGVQAAKVKGINEKTGWGG